MVRILEKSIISKYLRVIYDFEKKNFWPILKIFFIPRSPRTTRNNRSSPHNGPIKEMFH
jgi:hypothetical protein